MKFGNLSQSSLRGVKRRSNPGLLAFFLLLTFLFSPTLTFAVPQVPRTIVFQGILVDAGGNPLTDVSSANATLIDEIQLSDVLGDYFYQTGTDASGNYVFIRKHLLDEREEIDLLGGADLLVQKFDVTSEGDVYFGALDLNTTQVYLYKYNNSTGELETVESLSSDLSQIITLE